MNEFYNKMKYFEDTEGIQEETYYHYTTLEALYNIVKNKTFWLTSLKSSMIKKNCIIKHQIFLKIFPNYAKPNRMKILKDISS